MKKNLRVISLYFLNSFQGIISTPATFLIFFIAKLARYGFFIVFLYFLISNLGRVGGFTPAQMLVFYLSFNLIDTSSQMLFREVYRFRPLVVSGDLDGVLAKPFSPLLRVLVGGPDFIDVGVLVILIAVITWFFLFSIHPTLFHTLLYTLLILNSLIISAAFHTVVLATGILTFSVDHLVMIYRDVTSLMRIPVDFFPGSLRTFLTFVVPIGIMFTIPAKALLGLLSWPLFIASFAVSGLAMYIAIVYWRYALRHYQSASS